MLQIFFGTRCFVVYLFIFSFLKKMNGLLDSFLSIYRLLRTAGQVHRYASSTKNMDYGQLNITPFSYFTAGQYSFHPVEFILKFCIFTYVCYSCTVIVQHEYDFICSISPLLPNIFIGQRQMKYQNIIIYIDADVYKSKTRCVSSH